MTDITQEMATVHKYEAETLRNIVKQCGELLFKYGWKFDKPDRDKALDLVALIKNKEQSDAVIENVRKNAKCK